jgi:hypothetical protein
MTGPRAIIRHEQWTLTPDREPDAPPLLYQMKCSVDGDVSPESESWNGPQKWALEHSGQNPSHHSYSEIITRPWRTWRHL